MKQKGVEEDIKKWRNSYDYTILMEASMSGHVNVLKWLIQELQFDVNELLLPKETKIACVDISDDSNYLKQTPLLLFKSKVENDPDDFRYFMLPLSPKAIQVFGSELSSVL